MSKNRLATDSDSATPLARHARIGVAGCQGRVGRLLVAELLSRHWDGLTLAGGTVKRGHPTDGMDIGEILGQAPIGVLATSDPELLFDVADIVIDFTTPEATARHIWLAAKTHTPMVIGTTGLKEAQESEIADAAKECAIVYAANMSIGVNLLMALVEQAAARLGPDWDIEINETHHKHKVDAPSGTALALGKAAASGRKTGLDEQAVYSREGHTGERKPGQIGFSVQRGGDVVGEHTVSFFGEGERLELRHIATNRALFARGALRAAQWLPGRKNGLYSMRDVLNL